MVDGSTAPDSPAEVVAPAKLTLSLRITGVRPDGYHLLAAEMVTVDLADTLRLGPGDHLTVSPPADEAHSGPAGWWSGRPVPTGPTNLVVRALRAVGRTAGVDLVKRIPPGAGLGGGSADAAAVLRWAGRPDLSLAAGLGADVPFCVTGGRAVVGGIGELLEPLPYVARRFVLLLLPFGVDTAAAYRAWDDGAPPAGAVRRGVGAPADPDGPFPNDLLGPAVACEPRLGAWIDRLAATTGRPVGLAGSGSTLFVEGTPEEVGVAGTQTLRLGAETGLLVPVRTVPATAVGAGVSRTETGAG